MAKTTPPMKRLKAINKRGLFRSKRHVSKLATKKTFIAKTMKNSGTIGDAKFSTSISDSEQNSNINLKILVNFRN
jgi:hypothetical protein